MQCASQYAHGTVVFFDPEPVSGEQRRGDLCGGGGDLRSGLVPQRAQRGELRGQDVRGRGGEVLVDLEALVCDFAVLGAGVRGNQEP